MAIGWRDHWGICLDGLVGAEAANGIRAFWQGKYASTLLPQKVTEPLQPRDSGKRKEELSQHLPPQTRFRWAEE